MIMLKITDIEKQRKEYLTTLEVSGVKPLDDPHYNETMDKLEHEVAQYCFQSSRLYI
jgi:hypothetical protein